MKQVKDRDLFSVKRNKHKEENKLLKKKKKQKHVKAKKNEKEKESGEKDNFTIEHDPLSFENVHVGQVILGSVSLVLDFHIKICLPNKLTGFLPVMYLSNSYNNLLTQIAEGDSPSEKVHKLRSLYPIGKLIVTKVISAFDKFGNSKITLSALPEDVNLELNASVLSKHSILHCAVASEEESGYIMETGIKNIRSAFLSKKYTPEGSVGVGSVLLCAVKKVTNLENIGEIDICLSAEPSYVNKEIEFSSKKINMASIFPGSLVSGTIANVIPEGLELSFGEFKGFVNKFHLNSIIQKLSDFKSGQNVLVRVLYINKNTLEIVCSMNSKLCSESALKSELSSLKISRIYTGKIVKRLSNGMYFALPEGNYGFCSKNDLSRGIEEKSLKFDCRVTFCYLIDQMYLIKVEKKELDNESVLIVGQHVSVKIIKENYSEYLAVIDETEKICKIPKDHLSDPKKKLPIGDVFKGRILINHLGEVPIITLKTELVTSELPIITEISDSNRGIITLGYITKIKDHQLIVKFFNDCTAFINKPPYLKEEDLSSHFQVGSVVKCRIGFCFEASNIMHAVLLRNVKEDKKVKIKMVKNKKIEKNIVPKVVNCKIVSVSKESIQVNIQGSDEKGCIPFYNFSDDVAESKSVFRLLNEGDEIENAVVFAKSGSDFILSVKPSVYHYVKKPENFEREDKYVFPSVVKHCFEEKISVSILGKNYASECNILMRDVINENVNSVLNLELEEGQMLFLRKKLESSKFCSHLHRVLLNSRTSGLQVLYDRLLQEAMIKKLCSELKAWKLKDVVIGAFYDGEVIYIGKAGSLVRIAELGLDGVIHRSQYSDSGFPRLHKPLKVRVLKVDYYALCLELTLREDIKEYFCKKNHNLKIKQEAKCDILLAKKKYIIGRLHNVCPGQIIYLPSRRHINDFQGRHSYYETAKQYDIVIEHIDEELVLANLKAHTHEEYLGLCKEIPSITFSSSYPRNLVDDLLLDETHYTQQDFNMRALAKINAVGTWFKKSKKFENLDKWEILKNDNFSQLDEDVFFANVKEKRRERKKLKKNLPTKRKHSDDLDEEATAEQSDNLVTHVQRKQTLRSETKKIKLDLINQDGSVKENYEQEIGVMTEVNSDSESMNEDDSHDSDTDNKKCLKFENFGFDWSGQILETRKEDPESSSDVEIEDTKEQKSVKKLSKYEKLLKEKTEEKRTRELELERLDDEREPQTALDFEEKIEQNPHSSTVWIEYISFHLENTETEKAKAVASRALKTIPPTKEEERLALWNVSLRLEEMYGTHESVQNLFRDAVSRNDELKIYNIMIDIFLNANKLKEADELIKKMVKKHSQNREVWIKAFGYCFQVNDLTEARNILDRSLISLPKSDHIEVISRFAQLELIKGDPERGKTIFETLLSNFPKRLDIWNVYADLLLKQKDIEGSRTVLERITGLKLKMLPMRKAFKKLLEFEKKYGTPTRVEAVKAKVEEYVTAALADEK